jgi:ribosomal protein L11 methyltransferase
MAWTTLRLHLPAPQAEAFSEALMDAGALSVSLEDAAAGTRDETPIFGEPDCPDAGLWEHCEVLALFDASADIPAALHTASRACGLAQPPASTREAVPEQDWVRATQAQFSPIAVSPRLWIVPTWHDTPDSTAINIRLDPGLAFGTGSHPTTHLCLEWLDRHLYSGASVLDYGCGSGILAIAAKKLGAGPTSGIDIDPQAVTAARYNAQINDVQADFADAGNPASAPVDIVIANILTNPLKTLAPLLAGQVRPAGDLVLSGILAEQAGDVCTVYAPWFDFQPPAERDGWIRLWGRRR